MSTMFVNRLIFRSLPTVKNKFITPAVSSVAEMSTCYARSSSSLLFGHQLSKGFHPVKEDFNKLSICIAGMSRSRARQPKKNLNRHHLPYTDAQHFTLLKAKEKRFLRVWDPEAHKLQMEKLGVTESEEEEEDAKELRLQSERSQQNAVLSEIENQLLDPRQQLFAVVQITGRQYKVSEGDILIIQGYWAPNIGDRLRFEKVLLVGSSDFTLVGQPMVDWTRFRIEGTVIEKTLSDIKYHFRMRKRNNYRRLNFNKFPYTMVRINQIEYERQQLE